jgi:CubicO group peptidase (beta-lactamase class C family)
VFTLLFAAALSASPLAGDLDGLTVKAPSAVGMSAERLEAIDRVVQRGLNAGGYPGAAVVIGRKGAVVWQKGYGRLGWTDAYETVNPERSIYDLASLSKVVGTTTAIMVLQDQGKLDIEAPVSRYLPGFSGGTKDLVTVRHLLTHRSGLPAGRDLWRIAWTPEDAKRAVLSTPLECVPGQCFIYSDLGADVLGMVAEAVAGEPLDTFLDRNVFKPLGMLDTYYRPSDSLRTRIAPTEVTPPRGYPLRGEVHDENAYALGGVAGHAGLFSTAGDLAIFAQMMLNGGTYNGARIVSDSTVALFTRRAAGTRALGWDTADGDGGSGKYLSERAYGHLGYTGTSIWIDPDREMFVILLTNRVHVARARRPAKVISDVRNDLTDAASLAVMDAPDGPMAMPASFRADRMVGWNKSEATRSRRGGARSASSARSRKAAAARSARSRSAKGKATVSKSAGKSTSKARSRSKSVSLSKAVVVKKASAKRPTSKASASATKKKSAPARKPTTARKKR